MKMNTNFNSKVKIQKSKLEIPKSWFMPLLCLLVIFGALTIVDIRQSGSQLIKEEPILDKSAVFAFSPNNIVLGKGGTALFDLNLQFKNQVFLDGLDVVISFDPEVIEVSEIIPGKVFSYSVSRKEELTKGRILATFLEEKGGGVRLNGENKILSVKFKGEKPGETKAVIITAEKGPSTVITENGTSKKIKFERKDLTIRITE